MSSEILISLASMLLSLLFEYVPGLHDWYNALANQAQRLIMLGLTVIVAAAVFGLSCANAPFLGSAGVTCDTAGGWALVWNLALAVAVNQTTHRLIRRD